jgi:bifunctional non-homologous end joining protein LigD
LKTRDSRILYPRLGVSRDDVIGVYAEIAEWVMPHVEHRPLTVVRCKGAIARDDALRSECTFVRHTPRDNAWASSDIPRIRIPEKQKVGEYLYVESIEHLSGLIRRGVVEWHVWNATIDNVERPDRIVFDLDPGDGALWSDVVVAGRRLRNLLERLGLESWPRTTGGRGIHVVVPLARAQSWDYTFDFSRAVAGLMAREAPGSYTTSFAKNDRRGKVLIDYKRNHRTSIAVATFSTRARPTGTVAVPLRWNEVTARLQPERFTVLSIASRLRRLKPPADPWKDFWGSKQRLPVL